jgi:protein TonB
MKKSPVEQFKKNPQIVALVLSLLLHATMGGVTWFVPAFHTPSPRAKSLTEVELIDAAELLRKTQKPQDDKLKGQIVEQSDQRLNDEAPEESRFLSRFNQKVVQETQAAQKGKFKNTASRDGTAGTEKPAKKSPSHNEAQVAESKPDKTKSSQKNVLTSNDGIPVRSGKPSLKDLTPSFKPMARALENETAGGGASATDDHLKNVPTGMQTLLSTREFVYYTYYNRIKDKLRQYWEPKIKEKMEKILRQGRTIASTSDKITRIVILLDDKGTLVRVQVLNPSGVTDLDDAAIEAFKAAAPFPNPPKGIVETDGMIRIRWDFILEA